MTKMKLAFAFCLFALLISSCEINNPTGLEEAAERSVSERLKEIGLNTDLDPSTKLRVQVLADSLSRHVQGMYGTAGAGIAVATTQKFGRGNLQTSPMTSMSFCDYPQQFSASVPTIPTFYGGSYAYSECNESTGMYLVVIGSSHGVPTDIPVVGAHSILEQTFRYSGTGGTPGGGVIELFVSTPSGGGNGVSVSNYQAGSVNYSGLPGYPPVFSASLKTDHKIYPNFQTWPYTYTTGACVSVETTFPCYVYE